MRVAFFLHGFPPAELGGVELYTSALVNELRTVGLDCMVLAGSSAPVSTASLSTSVEGGVQVTRFCTPRRRPPNRALEWEPDAEALIRQFLVEMRPDLVHVQHWLRLGARLVALSTEVGIPAIVTLWDQFAVCPRIHRLRPNLVPCAAPYTEGLCLHCVDRDPWQSDDEVASALALRYRWIQQELALAARLIAPSPNAAEVVCRLSGLPRDRLEVLPVGWLHGVPFAPGRRSASNGTLKVGHWGHLHPYKGPHLLLLAARTLADGPPMEIHFWGEPVDPGYGEYLAALSEGLQVTFHGSYRAPDLQGADLDVAVFPSLCSETHSFVFDEALALGLPVIAPDRGALGARTGSSGMTFRSGSVSDLGRALREMGESLEARRALTAASSTALPQLAEHAQALLDLYRSVPSGQRVVPRQGADDSNPSAFLQTLVDARDRRLEDLAGRQATLREEQRRRSQEVARLEEGNGRLQQETERLETEIVRLEEELAKLEKGNGRLQQETGRLAADIVRLEEELANVRGSLQADRARLQEDLSQTRLRLASSEANLSEILGSRGWRLLTMLRRIKATVLGWR